MKKDLLQLIIIFIITPTLLNGQSNSWNGIIPLLSTKADVEKLSSIKLKDECSITKYAYSCRYILDKQHITVDYAQDRCKGEIYGFNVPKATVLKISVSGLKDVGKSFDQLNLSKDKFSLSTDDAFYGYWTNGEEGLRYTFSNINEELNSIEYIPKKSDNNLRCNGFPPYSPETQYFTMFNYGYSKPGLNKKDRLNWFISTIGNSIIELGNNQGNYNGYILVYFDNKLPFNEYKKLLNQAKEFIFKKLKISDNQISIIEGGMKEESRIEFYLLPKGWKPPTPNPTLSSPQFMQKQ